MLLLRTVVTTVTGGAPAFVTAVAVVDVSAVVVAALSDCIALLLAVSSFGSMMFASYCVASIEAAVVAIAAVVADVTDVITIIAVATMSCC